ncbi:inositol monophosphatase family protein [Lactobacillus sp. UCMA15818]|uniref:inositol monophosphatase family protein n=1 Tax=Lactobacillus sp. UCMA15818 TaxID=2583394 RepID=UPI0025B1A867|nr:inositol monophosphatase family protein [Lactobacillus sp. UCMA15818]MDN2452470.1 inositol monophosphatase family protein [Lactobacillus sp. UCMA15818]
MGKELEYLDIAVKGWMHEARAKILAAFDEDLDVWTKSGRNDLVTNVDKEVEKFYSKNIHLLSPEANIIGEESFTQADLNMDGLTWFVDPIDGTMNFVKQHSHFVSMIAVYENGKGLRGYIYDVIEDKLYWGGPDIGVFCNNNKMRAPDNVFLKDGLIGIGAPYLIHNFFNLQAVALASSGTRIYGSAGIQIIHVIEGKCAGYVSYLRPWDFAAGKILAETLGLSVKMIDGTPVNMLISSDVLVATKNAQKDIAKLIKKS